MSVLYQKTEEKICKICNKEFSNKPNSLKAHIQVGHKIKAEEYTEKYIYNGVRPGCKECGAKTRYVSYEFKDYCIEHSYIAESNAGKIGGKIKETWNKGETKESNDIIARQAINMSGDKNHFFGKQHPPELQQQIIEKKRIPFIEVIQRIHASNSEVDILSLKEDYETDDSLLKIRCVKCLCVSDVSLVNLVRCWRCRNCYPNASKPQLEIVNFIRNMGVDIDHNNISTKKIISPLELDIYIPEFNFAIEYHGLFWHSGGLNNQFTPDRHREKYIQCKKNGIKLFQFFSDEWTEKQDICKSMITNALGKHEFKLNARDCKIEQTTVKMTREFLKKNHINEAVNARYHFKIVHPEHGDVGVITYRVINNQENSKYKGMIEIARMAFKLNHSIRGGASKIMKFAENMFKDKFRGVYSYAELRYGEGNVYSKCGFQRQEKDTKINYWFCKDGIRYNRTEFQAKPGLSQKQVVAQAGVKQIEGAGNAVYIKLFGEEK